MTVEYISEAAAHGYGQGKEARRRRARKAGLASGRARRRMADPRMRAVKQRELALNFRVRIVDRAEFARLDAAQRLRAGIGPSERGLETRWQLYLARVRSYKAKGQGFCTTNAQSARALELAGRRRCRRTVQRTDALLAEMGLLRRYHDRRGGSAAGNRDRLRVQLAPSFVTLPLAARAVCPTGTHCSSPAPKRGHLQGRSADARDPAPPPGASEGPALAPGADVKAAVSASKAAMGEGAPAQLEFCGRPLGSYTPRSQRQAAS